MIIFCDEVFSGLSMSEIAGMIPLIEKLKMEGVTLDHGRAQAPRAFPGGRQGHGPQFGEKIAEGVLHGCHRGQDG